MSQTKEGKSLDLDALLPPQMAARAELVGEAKAKLNAVSTFLLAVLAGAFIAWGAVFSTTATTLPPDFPYGIAKLAAGLSFCLGLILVIVAGAELFTGNNLIVMAWASGKVTTQQLLRNWSIVYAGNFVGAVGIAVLMHLAKIAESGGGAVGDNMLRIANAKCQLDWPQAIAAGIGCNVLVCLAVWLCLSARTVTDKVMAILFPISAFVAAGLEHCVANMYFVPVGLLTKYGRNAMEGYESLTMQAFLWNNLIPVTIGNIIGGAGLVGLVYWIIYLRPTGQKEPSSEK